MSGVPASSCWNAWSRARSGPSAITPRSALWPSTANSSAWWPSSTSDCTASSDALARLRVGLRALAVDAVEEVEDAPSDRRLHRVHADHGTARASDRLSRRARDRSTVWSAGGACTSTRNAEVGDLHRHLDRAAAGAERAGVDREVHLHDAVVVVDPHVGGHRAQLRQLVARPRRTRRAASRRPWRSRSTPGSGWRARPATVSSPTFSTSPERPCRYSRPCCGPFDSRLVGQAAEVAADPLLQLVEAHLHPLLAAELRRERGGHRSSCRRCRRRSAPRSVPSNGTVERELGRSCRRPRRDALAVDRTCSPAASTVEMSIDEAARLGVLRVAHARPAAS